MVSSYMGHPILYAHLIWNHFTAAFLRYGTLIHFEDCKDTICNKYKKWMVSSYTGHPILHAPHMKPYYCSVFEKWDIMKYED